MAAVLGKSLRVFREASYQAASSADLTEAVELASGSVYKPFKDKQSVWQADFDREAKRRGEKRRRLLVGRLHDEATG